MLKYKASILLIASALLVLPGVAAAQSGKGGKDSGVTATAASKGAVTAEGLMQRYEGLAGSYANAESLVMGLRNKAEIVLVGTEMVVPPTPAPAPTMTPTMSPMSPGGGCAMCPPPPPPPGPTPTPTPVPVVEKFMPPTEGMGWGNIDIALALAEADLKSKQIGSPKPKELKAALVGGYIGPHGFAGVLRLRAEGNGWGEVAKTLGFELK